MMEYPKFYYRYVAQPSLYNHTEFCLSFLLAFFAKLKMSPKYPKIEIVTDCYRVFFIRLFPFTVAFHSKNDLIIKMFHPGHRMQIFFKESITVTFSHKQEDHWSCKRSPDISANYKHKTWLQMTRGFFSTSFYFDI